MNVKRLITFRTPISSLIQSRNMLQFFLFFETINIKTLRNIQNIKINQRSGIFNSEGSYAKHSDSSQHFGIKSMHYIYRPIIKPR